MTIEHTKRTRRTLDERIADGEKELAELKTLKEEQASETAKKRIVTRCALAKKIVAELRVFAPAPPTMGGDPIEADMIGAATRLEQWIARQAS